MREPGCQTDRTKQIHRGRVIDEASSATEEIWRCKCGFEIPAKHCFKIDLNIIELAGRGWTFLKRHNVDATSRPEDLLIADGLNHCPEILIIRRTDWTVEQVVADESQVLAAGNSLQAKQQRSDSKKRAIECLKHR